MRFRKGKATRTRERRGKIACALSLSLSLSLSFSLSRSISARVCGLSRARARGLQQEAAARTFAWFPGLMHSFVINQFRACTLRFDPRQFPFNAVHVKEEAADLRLWREGVGREILLLNWPRREPRAVDFRKRPGKIAPNCVAQFCAGDCYSWNFAMPRYPLPKDFDTSLEF